MSNRSSPSSTDPSAAARRATVLAVAGLVLAAVAAYANSFSGPFIFDDLLSIPQNPTLRSLLASLVPPGQGVTVSGRPLLNLTFALNHWLSGEQVWSYHALNLLIHLCAGLTLFGIVRRTLRLIGSREQEARGRAVAGDGRRETGGRDVATSLRSPASGLPAANATFLAFAVALLWTLHPLQTESVTYIVQRAESLMGLFYLLTLYCFLRGVEASGSNSGAGSREQGEGNERRNDRRPETGDWRQAVAVPPPASRLRSPKPLPLAARKVDGLISRIWFALSFLACVLGMATKEVMVTAPVLVFLYDRTFLAGAFREAWRRRRRIHLALAATWVPLLALVIHGANRGGTAGFGVGVGFWTYAATQFQAVAHYLWLSVWPHPLIIDYGVQWVASAGDVAPYAVVVAGLVAATVVALVRRPALGFLGAWFFAILSPTSLVPGTRQTLAEHRMYLPLAAVIAAVVLGAHGLIRWLGDRGPGDQKTKGQKDEGTKGPRATAGTGPLVFWSFGLLVLALAVGLGWLTVARNAIYRSDAEILHDTVVKRPGNAYAHNNYGNVLAQAGRPAEALAQYEAAIRIDPNSAEAYSNSGNALKRLGRLPEAIARYEQALRRNPRMPDVEAALGNALADSGRGDEAIAHYEQALRLDPNYADAQNDLGLALANAGRLPEAIAHYEQALKINPALPDVHNNLGNALRAVGRVEDAIAHYQAALRLKPEFAAAHNNLGNAFRELDRLPEAIGQYEEAVRIDPTVPEARTNLGISLLMAGRAPEAIAQFKEALRLNPNLGQVHLSLAIALESVGRSREAAAEYEAARRLGVAVPEPGGPTGE